MVPAAAVKLLGVCPAADVFGFNAVILGA